MGLDALETLFTVCREGGSNLRRDEQQRLYDAFKRFWRASTLLGIGFVPKHHLSMHILDRSDASGNPKTYAKFEDESNNGRLKLIAATCHRATFFWRVLVEWRIAYSPLRAVGGLLSMVNRPKRRRV